MNRRPSRRPSRLGKHTTGKGCLYVKRVADVDEKVLEELVRVSAAHTRERQQCDKCVADRAEKKATRAVAKKPKSSARKTVATNRRT